MLNLLPIRCKFSETFRMLEVAIIIPVLTLLKSLFRLRRRRRRRKPVHAVTKFFSPVW